MSYKCGQTSLKKLEGATNYTNPWGHQCVALVQGCSNAPLTRTWKRGQKVLEAKLTEIPKGTIIATFDEKGNYPSTQRHAAVYLSHTSNGIWVYHQYEKGVTPKKVHRHFIRNKNGKIRTTMDASFYYVVE